MLYIDPSFACNPCNIFQHIVDANNVEIESDLVGHQFATIFGIMIVILCTTNIKMEQIVSLNFIHLFWIGLKKKLRI